MRHASSPTNKLGTGIQPSIQHQRTRIHRHSNHRLIRQRGPVDSLDPHPPWLSSPSDDRDGGNTAADSILLLDRELPLRPSTVPLVPFVCSIEPFPSTEPAHSSLDFETVTATTSIESPSVVPAVPPGEAITTLTKSSSDISSSGEFFSSWATSHFPF
ncbi:hypothetical protein ACHAXS_012855 [Conticribra weissflogii]